MGLEDVVEVVVVEVALADVLDGEVDLAAEGGVGEWCGRGGEWCGCGGEWCGC